MKDGILKNAAGVAAKIEDYEAINDAQNLGVCPVGWYPKGSVVAINADGCISTATGGVMGYDYDLGNYVNTKHLEALDNLPPSYYGMHGNPEGEDDNIEHFITYSGTQQDDVGFIADMKKAGIDLSTPARVFNNSNGHLELTAATGTNFNGEITGGEVSLSYTTTATLTSMKVVGITANYTYESGERFEAPDVGADNYITVAHTAAKTDTEAQAECLGKFAGGSTITTFNGTADATGAIDNRKDFPGILADSTLNSTENKLATDHIPSAIKSYDAAAGLNVDKAINIQFVGDDDLIFANGGTDKVIEFKGVNSAYTGVASFADAIEKVHASGDNTLPQKLASGMGNITVEITGENTIDNSGSTTIKSLKVNSGAKLKVAAGTTLTVGGLV